MGGRSWQYYCSIDVDDVLLLHLDLFCFSSLVAVPPSRWERAEFLSSPPYKLILRSQSVKKLFCAYVWWSASTITLFRSQRIAVHPSIHVTVFCSLNFAGVISFYINDENGSTPANKGLFMYERMYVNIQLRLSLISYKHSNN